MNFVDWIVLGAIIVFAWTGWRSGFIAGLLSFVGFICGGLLGSFVAPWALKRTSLLGIGGLILTAAIVPCLVCR